MDARSLPSARRQSSPRGTDHHDHRHDHHHHLTCTTAPHPIPVSKGCLAHEHPDFAYPHSLARIVCLIRPMLPQQAPEGETGPDRLSSACQTPLHVLTKSARNHG
ncbi:hypothetical protein ACJQWK_11637 [Exserohilum turcicum]